MVKLKALPIIISVFVLFACQGRSVEPTATVVPTATHIPICPLCFFNAPSPDLQPTSVVNLISKDQEEYFLLIEDRMVSTLLHSDRAVVENCFGVSDVSQTFNFTRATTSSVEIGTEVSTTGGVKDILQISVAAHYQINLSETKTYEMNINFIAPAGYRVIYIVEWYENWMEGRVFPADALHQGERDEYSYRAKTGIESRVPNPIPEACAPTATSSSTPTYEPTYTPTLTPTLEPSLTNTTEPSTTPVIIVTP